ncbi:MAG: hypothetical protein Q4D16_07840 [Eubacteriales bacterium]|nr:hypothetical protein [Eubacteriales bacterium]
MKGLIKYHMQQYMKTSRFVMPLAVFMIMLYSIYSSRPIGIVESFVSCGQFLFLIMVWIGITACDVEDIVSEQILVLRVRSAGKYYLSRTLFLCIVGALFSAAVLIFAAVRETLYGGEFFNRPLLFKDFLFGFIILTLCAVCGSSLGELSHSRIIRRRKNAVIAVFLLAVLAMIKMVFLERFPLSRFLLWVIPPISELSMIFSGRDYFSLGSTVQAAALLALSAAALNAVKIGILLKNKF